MVSSIEIKPVHPALLSFAMQKVKDKLVQEVNDAVLSSSGLHVTMSVSSTIRANWVDIGAITIPDVAEVVKKKPANSVASSWKHH